MRLVQLVAVAALLTWAAVPGMAQSACDDDFDDGALSSNWFVWQSAITVNVLEEGGELRFTAAANPICDDCALALVVSQGWAFDLGFDFRVRVDWRLTAEPPAFGENPQAGYDIAFVVGTDLDVSAEFPIGSFVGVDVAALSGDGRIFRWLVTLDGVHQDGPDEVRAVDAGTFFVAYNAALDRLTISTVAYGFDDRVGVVGLGGASGDGLAVVVLGGSVQGESDELLSGQAAFDNFVIDAGVIVLAGCAADLNGDGVLNAFDVFQFLGDYDLGACTGPSGDFNGDGICNAFDVFEFLGAYDNGNGCL